MSDSTITPATRWKVAAAAVAIHLCIGSLYAWSVFIKPLQAAHGWSRPELAAAFSLAFLTGGLFSAFRGAWMECRGPRRCAVMSAFCFGAGIAGAGIAAHIGSLWLLYATYGVLGGLGLGSGYVPPINALLKWFPDRRGLAGGMAVAGFGAAALLTGPAATELISVVEVPLTFAILGAAYFVVILLASRVMRFPPPDYRPEGWVPRSETAGGLAEKTHTLGKALQSPRFWLLWAVFFLNISAGMSLISFGAPMAQEIVGMTAVQASVMVGFMGVFNAAGRIGWSALSDYIGRPVTFAVMVGIQIVLFALVPNVSSVALFQAAFFVIMTCFGGGFATCPAFVTDLFGSRNTGAIYGVILTAWSAAGVAGPTMAAMLRDLTGSYSGGMHVIAGALAFALVCVAALGASIRGRTAAP
ncbi:MAG TPA: OFA family MFS transporter [Candidatus Latescibacteria bacterium]|nr:OFA family MFS transporter [Candidatus Latescibacterota bacterium]HPK75489.1 OFA family MFS transporter [Candidatus Latescibacterota bacterium]